MKIRHFSMMGYFLLIALLHVNAMLNYEDPIKDGQTEAISYDQKMEQEKDGVKAAATPRIIYYGGQGFLTKSSLAKYEKDISAAKAGKKKDGFNWSDWWEEKPNDESDTESEGPVADDAVLPEADVPTGLVADAETITEPEVQKSQPKSAKPEVSIQNDQASTKPASPSPDLTPTEAPEEPSQGKSKGDDWW